MSAMILQGDCQEIRIAALFVEQGGVYYGLPDVEPWGNEPGRDARNYKGPYPVVAHPPCARWGRYWSGGPSAKVRRKLGDDEGCFEAALNAVRAWSGVIEHPEASHAWTAFQIAKPPRWGGWINAGLFAGGNNQRAWTCCVEQGHYGHRARKATWLLAVGATKPTDLIWGLSDATTRLDDGYHSAEERARATKTGIRQRLSHRERKATPMAFQEALIRIARALTGRRG